MNKVLLGVNIDHVATIRQARGTVYPDPVEAALLAEAAGADGITVHPRPDERHIRYSDVIALKSILTTEFNIEGNPSEKKFLELVQTVIPEQVTLVPDANAQLTSDHGWDTVKHKDFLQDIEPIATSIFRYKPQILSRFLCQDVQSLKPFLWRDPPAH